jgi:hypothetical protein
MAEEQSGKVEASDHGAPVHGAHEERDVVFRPIVLAAVGLLAVIVFVFVSMQWLFDYYAAREARRSEPNPLAESYARELPPEPRLQTAPVQDLRQLRAAEDAVLNSYGWIDRKNGVVRIPIERAMELLARRGLPATEGAAEVEK